MKVKGVAERGLGLGQDKRERGEGRERNERSGSRTRQQPNLELQQHLIIYHLPMESTTHTPKKYVSFNTMYSFYPHPTKINSVFDRILGGNCQVFRGVGS